MLYFFYYYLLCFNTFAYSMHTAGLVGGGGCLREECSISWTMVIKNHAEASKGCLGSFVAPGGMGCRRVFRTRFSLSCLPRGEFFPHECYILVSDTLAVFRPSLLALGGVGKDGSMMDLISRSQQTSSDLVCRKLAKLWLGFSGDGFFPTNEDEEIHQTCLWICP